MINPFQYGKPVEGEYYYDLPTLKKEMNDFVNSKINVLLMGQRRSGKTSFLKSFLAEQRAQKRIVLDIDAFNVQTHKDFLNRFLLAVKAEKSATRSIFDWLRNLKSLTPIIKWSANTGTGEAEYSLNFNHEEVLDAKQALLETLPGSLKELLRQGPVIVSIDEFQRIGEIDDNGWLEATLRSVMQELPDITWIFTGSRRSLLEDMFSNSKRPFYRSSKQIQFPSFGPGFTDWIISRFKKTALEVTPQVIDYLRFRIKDSPNYVQEACFHLVSHGINPITEKEIEKILDIISSQSSYVYQSFMNAISSVQIRTLRMLVVEGKVDYSKETLRKYELKNGSTVQAGLRALVEKQFIIKEIDGTYTIDDPMFQIWLKKKME